MSADGLGDGDFKAQTPMQPYEFGYSCPAMRTSLVAIAALTTAGMLVGASAVGCGSRSQSKAPRRDRSPRAPLPRPGERTTDRLLQASDPRRRHQCARDVQGQPADSEPEWQTRCGDHVHRRRRQPRHPRHHRDPAGSRRGGRRAQRGQGHAPGPITGTPVKANVGTGGVTISGDLPDKSKGVTVLLFTEGKAFVTLEFDGPTGVPAPPEFVTDVGQKQDASIKKGLPA
ncbi:putative conserved membrane protein [Mycobacterium xenopi 3993]|nr:putative conserved membrane protein [Mycobacterium xenopi 3993]